MEFGWEGYFASLYSMVFMKKYFFLFFIFEGNGSSFEQLSFKVVGFYLEYGEIKVKKRSRVPCFPFIEANGVIGFFDGASQMDNCGCGFCIKLSSSHLIYGWFGGGEGSNTRAELLVCWGLLLMVYRGNISPFHVCGNSKSMVDWVVGKAPLQVSALGYWQ